MAKKILRALSISMSVLLGSSFFASLVSAETIVHNDRSHRKMIFEQDMAAAREAAARHSGYAKQAEAPVYPVQSEESVQPVEAVQPEREAAPLVEPDAKEAAPSAASNVEPAAEAPVTAVKEAESSVETAETMPNRDTAVEAPAANSELAADAEETAANSEPAAAAEETAPVVEEAPPVPEGSSAIESVSVGEVPPVAEASASEPESEAVAPVQGEAVTEPASEPAEPAGHPTEAAESAAPAAEQPEEAKQLETVQQSEQVIPAQAEEPQEIKVLMHDFVLSRYAQDSWVVKVLAKPDAPVYRPESEGVGAAAEDADTAGMVSEV